MGYSPLSADLPQLKWGREKEAIARDSYVEYMRKLGHKDLSVKSSGLTLLPSHSFLGASADGLILNHRHHSDTSGVLEIKCPFSINKKSVTNCTPHMIATRYPDYFLTSNENGKIGLKTTHNYYHQVQGEMAIKGCTWAHFVVWTAAESDNLHVEEIKFDEDLWANAMLPKLTNFYE